MKFFTIIQPESAGTFFSAALEAFERQNGVTLTIHDCRGVLNHPDGSPFFPERYIHTHRYCLEGRFEHAGWNLKCHKMCMLDAEAVARASKRPFRHDCWKGVTELIVPVVHNETVAMVLYAGLFRTPEAAAPDDIPEELRRIYRELPEIDDRRFEELAVQLELFGQGVRHHAEHCRKPADAAPQPQHERVLRFIADRAHEPVGLAELADYLCLSRTHTCHVVKFHFGRPFHALLLEERITRAKNLLSGSELPLKAIAAATGFASEFYFSRLFKRECGMPPGEFRRSP